MDLPRIAKEEKGQAQAVNAQITLIVSLMVAVIVVYQLFIAGVGPTDVLYVSGATELTNNTFTTDASAAWDNVSRGDNNNLQWDNWNPNDNAIFDNVGDIGLGGVMTENYITRWWQSLTLPTTYNAVTAASITGSYMLASDSGLDNFALAVYLQRPGGDNIPILVLDNLTGSADNDTFIAMDNDVLSYITAAGTYILFLEDNIDRIPLDAQLPPRMVLELFGQQPT